MSDVVISVRGVSKQYRIGAKEQKADTLLGAIRIAVAAPFRNYRQIRNLTQLKQESESVFWALDDVSFDVKQGEVLGIIGKNGAGKSTLLKILSRITDPTKGEVAIRGRVSSLLEVGTGFHPELTGRENIYMNGTILGMRKREIDVKLDEIVDFSGIETHLDTPVKFYSSGMKVRLGFAVAANLDPEILIVDEVLAVGDTEFQKKCLGRMKNVAGSGRTVLFVSHDLNAVQALCPTSKLLLKGKIDFSGETHSVVRRYLKSTSQNRVLNFSGLGNNAITFSDFVIHSDSLGEGDKLDSGKSNFVLTYDTHFEGSADISIAITIKDQLGVPIVTLWNYFVNNTLDIRSGHGRIVCEIDEFPLATGTYIVHLWCAVNGDLSTLIESFAEIEKVDDNYFGTGRVVNPRNHGPVLLKKQKWHAEQ